VLGLYLVSAQVDFYPIKPNTGDYFPADIRDMLEMFQDRSKGELLYPAPCGSESLPPGSGRRKGRANSAQQVGFFFLFKQILDVHKYILNKKLE
jgi:hypothetical protein